MKIEIPKLSKKSLMGVKSRGPQKAHLGPLLDVHTQFQLNNSNLEMSYADTEDDQPNKYRWPKIWNENQCRQD